MQLRITPQDAIYALSPYKAGDLFVARWGLTGAWYQTTAVIDIHRTMMGTVLFPTREAQALRQFILWQASAATAMQKPPAWKLGEHWKTVLHWMVSHMPGCGNRGTTVSPVESVLTWHMLSEPVWSELTCLNSSPCCHEHKIHDGIHQFPQLSHSSCDGGLPRRCENFWWVLVDLNWLPRLAKLWLWLQTFPRAFCRLRRERLIASTLVLHVHVSVVRPWYDEGREYSKFKTFLFVVFRTPLVPKIVVD